LWLAAAPGWAASRVGRGAAGVPSQLAGFFSVHRPLADVTPAPGGGVAAPPTVGGVLPPPPPAAVDVTDASLRTLQPAIRQMVAAEVAKWDGRVRASLDAAAADVDASVAAQLAAAEAAAAARLDAALAAAGVAAEATAAARSAAARELLAADVATAAAATEERAVAAAKAVADASCAAAAARGAAGGDGDGDAAAVGGGGGGPTGAAFDAFADRVIERYEADKGRPPDFALLSAGARVEASSPTAPSALSRYATRYALSLFGRGTSARVYVPAVPRTVDVAFTPGVVPGACWAFEGVGTVTVRLARPVVVTGFTVEHAPAGATFTTATAPRAFSVSGVPFVWPPRPPAGARDDGGAAADGGDGAAARGGAGAPPTAATAAAATGDGGGGGGGGGGSGGGGGGSRRVRDAATRAAVLPEQQLGDYVYRVGAGHPHVQAFEVRPSAGGAYTPMRAVTLVVRGNQGHPHYTCLYRFRVHGTEVTKRSPPGGV